MMDLYGSDEAAAIETTSNKYPSCYLLKALQFLVPLSLLILSSYNFHFSHALERKYMFLICNGILFFLVKTLTFTSSFTHPDYTCLPPPFNVQSPPPETLIGLDDHDMASKNDDALQLQQEEDEKEEEIFSSSGHAGALKVEFDDEKGEGEEGGAGLMDALHTEEGEEEGEEEEEEVEEEDNDMNINTEEFNRRVEEFIRKMKEEIRIEAKQQHLIAAV